MDQRPITQNGLRTIDWQNKSDWDVGQWGMGFLKYSKTGVRYPGFDINQLIKATCDFNVC